MTNKHDSSAPSSPEVTGLSGEQAEERTAREGRCPKCLAEPERSCFYINNAGNFVYLGKPHRERLAAECSRLASRNEQLEREREQADRDYEAGRLSFLEANKGLASRVEELEKQIAKHSGSLNSADSASGSTSEMVATEIRKLVLEAERHFDANNSAGGYDSGDKRNGFARFAASFYVTKTHEPISLPEEENAE